MRVGCLERNSDVAVGRGAIASVVLEEPKGMTLMPTRKTHPRSVALYVRGCEKDI